MFMSKNGQKQKLRQSVKLMMPCGVIPQLCMFNTQTHARTLARAHTRTHRN